MKKNKIYTQRGELMTILALVGFVVVSLGSVFVAQKINKQTSVDTRSKASGCPAGCGTNTSDCNKCYGDLAGTCDTPQEWVDGWNACNNSTTQSSGNTTTSTGNKNSGDSCTPGYDNPPQGCDVSGPLDCWVCNVGLRYAGQGRCVNPGNITNAQFRAMCGGNVTVQCTSGSDCISQGIGTSSGAYCCSNVCYVAGSQPAGCSNYGSPTTPVTTTTGGGGTTTTPPPATTGGGA